MSFGGPATVAISAATDVALNSPAAGNFLGYNSGTAKWNNLTLNGYAAMATGGGVETLSALGNRTGATAINLANGNVFSVTLTGNVTFTFPTTPASTACSFGLYIKQDGTGGRTVTWPTSSVKWAGGAAPSLSTAANALDILVFETIDGGTTWYGSLVGLAFA
jgi:hypothetical protein